MTAPNPVTYTDGGADLLPVVEPLWHELNAVHQSVSVHFAPIFAHRTFAQRTARLLGPDIAALYVVVARVAPDVPVGYCMASVDRHAVDGQGGGEFDSIYVQPAQRGQGVAHELMTRSLAWLRSCDAGPVRIRVVAGNERAFGFYARYGFYPHHTVLMQSPAK